MVSDKQLAYLLRIAHIYPKVGVEIFQQRVVKKRLEEEWVYGGTNDGDSRFIVNPELIWRCG